MMTATRSIAAAQTIPVRGDVDANLEQHLRLIRIAAEERAKVVVFPELSLTGYELDLAESLAFSETDVRLSPLLEAASSGSITVLAGAPVRVGALLHIGALIIAPDGTVDLYTKHHLGEFLHRTDPSIVVPPPERTVFRPGDRNPLLHFGGKAAAVAVCADTNEPSHPRKAAARGAEIYLAGVFITPSGFESDAANLRGAAVQHSMVVAMANFGGPSGGLQSAGRSSIWSEPGDLLVQLQPAGAGLAIAAEEAYGWRAKSVVVH